MVEQYLSISLRRVRWETIVKRAGRSRVRNCFFESCFVTLTSFRAGTWYLLQLRRNSRNAQLPSRCTIVSFYPGARNEQRFFLSRLS